MSPPADRLPPHSREAERGVLAGVLRDPDARDAVARLLSAADFYFDPHRRVYEAAEAVAAAGGPVDAVTVFEHLRRAGQAADLGGADFLTDLLDADPTGATAAHYARIVREKAAGRAVIRAATAAVRDLEDGRPADEVRGELEGRLHDLGADRPAADPVPLRETVREALDRVDERQAGRGAGVGTGFPDLDRRLGGLREGLYYLAARPSVGKTALMLAIALAAALAGVPVLVFSLEMARADLLDRLLAMLSGVPLRSIQGQRPLTAAEVDRVAAAGAELAALPVEVLEAAELRAGQLAAVARRHARRRGTGLVCVDYLQLLEPDSRREPRHEQVAAISRRMKRLSRQLRCPVLCLAQLNREAEKRGPAERPRLSDLRESGQIEADADAVLLLWPLDAPEDREVWSIGCSIAKHRNGPVGELKLAYRRPCVRFESHHPGW
jgi:replicative DNA helicase